MRAHPFVSKGPRRRDDARPLAASYAPLVTAVRAVLANPLIADGLLAAALTALSVITLLAGARDIGSYEPASIALLFLQTVPLVVRRVAPLPVLALTGTATILHALFATDSLNTTLGSLIALFTVAETHDRRVSVPAGLILGGAMGAMIGAKAGLPASRASCMTW